MGAAFKWIGTAVRGLRSFAYSGEEDRPRVGIALGGGFARGIAHVGVLRALEQHGIPIDCISGTSVGALIAAAYAGGSTTEEMERQGAATRFRDFGRWTISRMGMASNERLEYFLQKFTVRRRFDEMKIPLGIVATDLLTGESAYITAGEIGPAIRASCAYPGLFLPIEQKSHVLVDGFLTESVPAVCARELGGQVVISVNLEPGVLSSRPRNTIEVISRSFSIMQQTAYQPWRDATDVLIEPDVHEILWDEFVKTPELVAAGIEATRAALPKIQAAMANWRRRSDDGRASRENGEGSRRRHRQAPR